MSVSNRIDPPSDPALATICVCRISASGQAVQPWTCWPSRNRWSYAWVVTSVDDAFTVPIFGSRCASPGHDLELACGLPVHRGRDRRTGAGRRHSRLPCEECGARRSARRRRRGLGRGWNGISIPSSSCGVCGKASLEAVRSARGIAFRRASPRRAPAVVHFVCPRGCGAGVPYSTAPAVCTRQRCSTFTATWRASARTSAGTMPWTR